MSEPNTEPQSTAAPAAPPPSPAPVAPQAAPAKPSPTPTAGAQPEPTDGTLPDWMKARLDQAQRTAEKKLLQKFGVESADDLDKKAARLKELEDAQLSEQERNAKILEELKPKAEERDLYAKEYAALVDLQFGTLPEAAQAAIDGVANGDARERMKIMRVMQAAGTLQIGVPPAPKPAQTAPAAAPPPANPSQPQTAYDKWEALRKVDPMQAAIFHQTNAFEIERSRNTQ